MSFGTRPVPVPSRPVSESSRPVPVNFESSRPVPVKFRVVPSRPGTQGSRDKFCPVPFSSRLVIPVKRTFFGSWAKFQGGISHDFFAKPH